MLVLSTLVCSCVGGGSWGQPSWSITATGSGHCLPEPPQGYQGPLTCDQEKVRYRQTDGQTDRRQSTTDWDKCIHFYLFISTSTCSVIPCPVVEHTWPQYHMSRTVLTALGLAVQWTWARGTIDTLTSTNPKAVIHSAAHVYTDIVVTKVCVPANSRHGSVVVMVWSGAVGRSLSASTLM